MTTPSTQKNYDESNTIFLLHLRNLDSHVHGG